MNRFLLFALFVLLFSSCYDEIENPSIAIRPVDYSQIADTGQVIPFSIKTSAFEGHQLKRITISISTKKQQALILLDSTLGFIKDFSYDFYFKVPNYTDTTEAIISFQVTDEAGNTSKLDRIIRVNIHVENSILTEFAGNTLYVDPDFHNTAFDLLKCETVNVETGDSSTMHIATEADTITHEKLITKWQSPAKLRFVKFNDFDYANATVETAKSAYLAGTKMDFIAKLSVNDIYICYVEKQYIVIRIMNIIDQAGSENDMFIFNIKKSK